MKFSRGSWIAGMTLCAVAIAAAGCGSTASKAGGNAGSAVSSAVSQGSSILGKIKNGVDAAGDVTAGPVDVGTDGHATTRITATNPTADQHDYTVAVSFSDQNGLQDEVVVNVPKVPAHGSGTADARSARKLSGTLTAKITAAVRH